MEKITPELNEQDLEFVVPEGEILETNNTAADISEANILPPGSRRRRGAAPARYTPEFVGVPLEDDYSLSEYDTDTDANIEGVGDDDEDEDEDFIPGYDEDEDEDEDYVPGDCVQNPDEENSATPQQPANGSAGTYSVPQSEKGLR